MRKFSGHKPVMFYQEANGSQTITADCSRVRIFYPGGHTEWATLSDKHNPDTSSLFFGQDPCWMYHRKPKSINEAIVMAMSFDKEQGYSKMQFLGEL